VLPRHPAGPVAAGPYPGTMPFVAADLREAIQPQGSISCWLVRTMLSSSIEEMILGGCWCLTSSEQAVMGPQRRLRS
jgi:hypothetical protein